MKVSGITNKLEKNAVLLTVAAGVLGRAHESGIPLGDIIKNIPFQVMANIGSIEAIKYQLWDAQHLPQALIKLGAVLYGASELGLLHKSALGKKMIKGGALAALITPGSGPAKTIKTSQGIMTYEY